MSNGLDFWIHQQPQFAAIADQFTPLFRGQRVWRDEFRVGWKNQFIINLNADAFIALITQALKPVP